VRSVMREMGRAMMGTGEASGEGRAMAAAEAAISNPLLDETSMAGSQGLLISITGGRDMTLFEVDEAATRIREEVDAEANIILGATFDESLEGIIRVSVVATGIDNENSVAAEPNSQRMNDAAERLRQSAIERSGVIISPEEPISISTNEMSDEAESSALAATPAIEIERPASAVPFEPESADFADPISDADFQSALEQQMEMPEDVESSPAASAIASPRMPSMKDFPQLSQAEAAPKPSDSENGPMGLLKRLATGLGGVSHATSETVPPALAAPVEEIKPQTFAQQPSQAAPSDPAAREDNNPYAPPRNGSLDIHGRPTASARPVSEDDQLDIPAFLRRQAN
ncbi:MAG: cell division protein FtsZ, partial [Rhizobiaceae bacterium]